MTILRFRHYLSTSLPGRWWWSFLSCCTPHAISTLPLPTSLPTSHTHTCTEIHTHTHTHRHTHSGFVPSSPSCCDCDEINMCMSVFLPVSQILFWSFLLPFSLSSWINTSSEATFVSAMLVGWKKDKKECGVSQSTSSIFVSILRSSSVFVLFTVSTVFLSPWHWKFFKV